MFFGLPYRTELIIENIKLNKNMDVLEIGVGTGYSVFTLADQSKTIWGIDISKETVEFLNSKNKKKNIFFKTLDICSTTIDKTFHNYFDIIFSMDTLEHVTCPKTFFKNIYIMLKKGGSALVGFNNQSKSNCHGITWFNQKNDLLRTIPYYLDITQLSEIKETKFVNFIIKRLWNPIYKISCDIGYRKKAPQIFHETITHDLNQKKPLIAKVLSIYPNMLTGIIRLKQEKFLYEPLTNDSIINKYILIKLDKKA